MWCEHTKIALNLIEERVENICCVIHLLTHSTRENVEWQWTNVDVYWNFSPTRSNDTNGMICRTNESHNRWWQQIHQQHLIVANEIGCNKRTDCKRIWSVLNFDLFAIDDWQHILFAFFDWIWFNQQLTPDRFACIFLDWKLIDWAEYFKKITMSTHSLFYRQNSFSMHLGCDLNIYRFISFNIEEIGVFFSR